MAFEIQIEDSVVLPKREAHFGPRESKYPFAQMKEGQGFAIPIKGVEGARNNKGETLTAAQDAERKSRQKQSAFSAIGKRLGINIKTRYVGTKPGNDADPYLVAKWAQFNGPFLVAQHAGPRAVEEASEEEAAAEAEEAEEAGEEAGEEGQDEAAQTDDDDLGDL